MASLRRALRLLSLATLAATPVILIAACNAQLATVLSSSDADADSPVSTGGASCSADVNCNEDNTISSLRGQCVSGVCVCNPGVVVTRSGKCGDSTSDSGPVADCVAKGGLCISQETPPPPNYRLAGNGEGTCARGAGECWVPEGKPPVPVCFNDQGCNGDPGVSALWGTCFYGVCMCKQGFAVQPNGKCNTPPPPACQTQKGTCRQNPATCLADELSSAQETWISCGDLVPATCCNKTASCAGPAREAAGAGWFPVDFICCTPDKSIEDRICVNGWQTCPKGDTPVAKPGSCL